MPFSSIYPIAHEWTSVDTVAIGGLVLFVIPGLLLFALAGYGYWERRSAPTARAVGDAVRKMQIGGVGGTVLLGIALAVAVPGWQALTAELVLTDDGVSFARVPYGPEVGGVARTVLPYDRLRLDDATHGMPEDTTRTVPRVAHRTKGIGVPGMVAGWVHLTSGEQALAYVRPGLPTVYLPTTEGYAVLVSLPDPAAFLEAVRARAGGGKSTTQDGS